MTQPVKFTIEFLLPTTSLQKAWGIFSDTDRFNRAAQMGFNYEVLFGPDGRATRVGSLRRLGLTITWEEKPFELEAPHWFKSTRIMKSGPLTQIVTKMSLKQQESGKILLRYDVALQPKNLFLRPLVIFESIIAIKPSMRRTIKSAIPLLTNPQSPWGPSVPALSAEAEELLSQIKDLPSGAALSTHLRDAELRDQIRMRPLALARQWGIEPEMVIQDFLTATQRGIIELRWDLLCPSCRGAKTRLVTLTLQPEVRHCESCNIPYDGSFPDSVEVTFQPAPTVRSIVVPIDCIFSPLASPHVVARSVLPAQQEILWQGELSVGAYFIEPESLGRASLEVRDGIPSRVIAIDVTTKGLMPAILRVGPGAVKIAIRSKIEQDVRITITRSGRPADGLTAGRLLEHQGALGLLSGISLPEGVHIITQEAVVLAIDVSTNAQKQPELTETLTNSSALALLDGGLPTPLHVYGADDAIVTICNSVKEALQLAQHLIQNHDVSAAINTGLVSLLQEDAQTIPSGSLVEQTIALSRKMGVKRLGLSKESHQNRDISQVIDEMGFTIQRRPGSDIIWLRVPLFEVLPRQDPPSQLVGGRYKLGKEIGRGGCGAVYEIEDTMSKKSLVIKALLPQWANRPDHVQRFFWEARVTAQIQHPNIVKVWDYGSEDQLLWIVMERLHGMELYDRLLTVTSLHWSRSVDIAIAVLDALQAAHNEGVIHRDIKPANVFLCTQPVDLPKVIDFGIALSLEKAEEDAASNLICGTLRYMSPEQVRGSVLDGRSDIYTVGLMLYEMVSGQLPFQEEDAMDAALQRLKCDAQPVHEVMPDLPLELSHIIMKALAISCDDRWQDAHAMAEALKGLAVES